MFHHERTGRRDEAVERIQSLYAAFKSAPDGPSSPELTIRGCRYWSPSPRLWLNRGAVKPSVVFDSNAVCPLFVDSPGLSRSYAYSSLPSPSLAAV